MLRKIACYLLAFSILAFVAVAYRENITWFVELLDTQAQTPGQRCLLHELPLRYPNKTWDGPAVLEYYALDIVLSIVVFCFPFCLFCICSCCGCCQGREKRR